jgi:hypothetical protein
LSYIKVQEPMAKNRNYKNYKYSFWSLFIINLAILINLFISYDYYHWEFSAFYLWIVLVYWLMIGAGLSTLVILINLIFFKHKSFLRSSFINVFASLLGLYGFSIWIVTIIMKLPWTEGDWKEAILCGIPAICLFMYTFLLSRRKNGSEKS